MARKLNFGIGEYYHIYNRGVDKRDIFLDDRDIERFKHCMEVLNAVTPIGSLRDLPRDLVSGEAPLVDFIAHHLLPNHYHFILRQRVKDGIPRFMHRIGVAHTMYFNERYKREGALFQGTYKAKHIDSNHYLLHASVYVNLNDRIHDTPSKLTRSSWKEYTDGSVLGLCKKEVILGQFSSPEAYAAFCEKTLPDIVWRKMKNKELRTILLE